MLSCHCCHVTICALHVLSLLSCHHLCPACLLCPAYGHRSFDGRSSLGGQSLSLSLDLRSFDARSAGALSLRSQVTALHCLCRRSSCSLRGAQLSTWWWHEEGWHFSCERETIMERQVHFQSRD